MKAPAFQLYAGDFLVDTIDWSLEEIGLYTRLLCVEWANGPLPSQPQKLAQIAGITPRKLAIIWPKIARKFVINSDEKYINLRLEETREKQDKYSESRKKGAAAKWSKTDAHAYAHADGMHMHNGCSPSPTPTPSPTLKQKNIKNIKHIGDAKKAWSEIEPEPDDIFLEKVLNTIRTFMPKWAEDEYKFVPLPATWIRAKRWNDEVVKPLNGNQDISQITRFAKGPAEWLRMRKQARGEL